MNLSNMAQDTSDALAQVYSILFRKPFLTVSKLQYTPQKDESGKITEELVSFTIANESSSDIEVQRIWFVTSFNRPIFSQSIDAKTPVKMPENARVTFSLPVGELKAELNKSAGDTIAKVVVLDKTGHQSVGRVKAEAQKVFAK